MSDLALPEGITGKQSAWLVAYLTDANLDATEAARIAGYADPPSAAYNNLRNERMQEAIREYLSAVRMSGAEVVARIERIARRSDDDRLRLKALEILARVHHLFADGPTVTVQATEFVLEVGSTPTPTPIGDGGDVIDVDPET